MCRKPNNYIDLQVTQDGKIEQKERSEVVHIPDKAADSAIFTRMEGWLVPQELRVQVQVEPKDAPILVTGTSGGMEGAAAILGASNIGMGISRRVPEKTKE